MKAFKVIISLLVTISLVYALNRSWSGVPGVGTLPAFGKFLDPFHGFWANSESGLTLPSDLKFPELKGEVKITYDSMLIPHVFATNEDDLYFAQGFITAYHRLWQMETQIRAGEGRLAEVLGPQLLARDRSQRRLGMVYAANNALKEMESDPITFRTLTSYTAGVNAFIETLNASTLPMEYKLLDYYPEPWTNFKCAMLLKNMAQTLNMGDKDIEMSLALTEFGKPMVDLLWPDDELTGDNIVDKAALWKFQATRLADSIPLAMPAGAVPVKEERKGRPSRDTGSNNWAVSGSKTATGSPLLCNDPHLNLSLPSIWYAIHLNAPGVNVMGSSLPGVPSIVIGFNDSIAWGVTNGQRDLVDHYRIETKKPFDFLKTYFIDGQWKPTTKVVEVFNVKGGEQVIDTITWTEHGPIRTDHLFQTPGYPEHFAFRWVSHDASNEMMTFYKLNRASNHSDYMEALNHFHSPAQNFVFASVSGDIAMRVQGKFPVRRRDEGKFLIDGNNSKLEWQAYIPFEQNVMDLNPKRGFVSSANQYPADPTYPYYIQSSSYEAYRNRRINQILTSLTSATPKDMMNLQSDNFNLMASENLKFMLAQLDSANLSPAEKTAWDILKSWNLYNNVDAFGASYFEAWTDNLFPIVWDEMVLENQRRIDFPTEYNTFKLMKSQPDLIFFDIKSTSEKETAKECVQKAFKLAVEDIEKWKTDKKKDPRWADFKDTIIKHLMGLDPLSVRVQHGGNHDIVNASTRTHGPSWRMIVSLEKTGIKAWGVYPGGQSGNAGSKYYANMIPMWGNGQYFSLPFASFEALQSSSIGSTTLTPQSK